MYFTCVKISAPSSMVHQSFVTYGVVYLIFTSIDSNYDNFTGKKHAIHYGTISWICSLIEHIQNQEKKRKKKKHAGTK